MVLSERQSILEAQMYQKPVVQTQAEIQNGSVNCLQQLQPTYSTSEQSEQAKTYNSNFSYMSQEVYPQSQVNCHRNFTNHQQHYHSNESFFLQPYYDQYQNHHGFFNQRNESVYYQQNQSARKSHYFIYPPTIPANNRILQNHYICGCFEENNFQNQKSVNLFNRFLIL